jgi:hypothetical protein
VLGSEYVATPPTTRRIPRPPGSNSSDHASRSTPRMGATARMQPLPSTAARGRARDKVNPDHCVVIFVLAGLQLSFLNIKRKDSVGKGDVHGTSASVAILPDPRIPTTGGRARPDAVDGPTDMARVPFFFMHAPAGMRHSRFELVTAWVLSLSLPPLGGFCGSFHVRSRRVAR